MNPQQNHITISRTVRYYTLGKLDQNTKDVWILIHGHKQLAGKFIKSFSGLAGEGSYLIAPEGLMRFYLKGDYGDVGASWMTREDRESDINDYVNYLDKVYEEVVLPGKEKFRLKIKGLGFSQGAATLSRWLALGRSKIDNAVFWCGNLAHDVDFSKGEHLKSTEIKLVFADKDQYYEKDFYLTQEKLLSDAGLKFETKIFSGTHEVSAELMKTVLHIP